MACTETLSVLSLFEDILLSLKVLETVGLPIGRLTISILLGFIHFTRHFPIDLDLNDLVSCSVQRSDLSYDLLAFHWN